MPRFTVTLPRIAGTREQIRAAVIGEFLKEAPGTGTGDLTSSYEYIAEEIPGIAKIVLRRPAWLNKGMDFTVHVAGREFKPKGANRDAPRHDHIIKDLDAKQKKGPADYKKIKEAILSMYACETLEYDELLQLPVSIGLHPAETLLATRWLFIEQDVTYWNSSGRGMLYSALHSRGLC